MGLAPTGSTLNLTLLNSRSVANKTFLLSHLIFFQRPGPFLLLETWQHVSDSASLIELCPAGYCFVSHPRAAGQGFKVFKSGLTCRPVNTDNFHSLELQLIKIGDGNPFYCAIVY